MFIRPNHKKQYRQMLDGLVGQPATDDACKDQNKRGTEHLTSFHNTSNFCLFLCPWKTPGRWKRNHVQTRGITTL